MIIRPTRDSDMDQLYALFLQEQVTARTVEINPRIHKGFFEYSLPESDFRKRMQSGPSLVLDNHGRIIAYLLSYHHDAIAGIIACSEHSDPVLERIVSSPLSDVMYIDQLAVAFNQFAYQAGRLWSAWEHEARLLALGVVGAVPEGSWTNSSSQRFALTHGLKRQTTVSADGVTLGLYAMPFCNVGEEISDFKL